MLMFQGPTLRITIGKIERYNAENGGLTPDNPLNLSLFWGGLHAASGMHFKKGLLNSIVSYVGPELLVTWSL